MEEAKRKCWRKRKHDTIEEAENARFALRYKGKAGDTLRAYQCKFCGKFHTGNL